MDKILTDLARAIEQKTLIPFVGSGLSASCGLPTWSKLIDHLVKIFSINPNLLSDQTDFLRIAEYIKIIEGGKIGTIRHEIQELFRSVNVNIAKSDPHLLLSSLNLPLIYTTNYDNLIEDSFQYLGKEFTKIITTRDIIKNSMLQATQIIKFHGSFEHEELMVLTESDYLTRLELETSLDLKLRHDIIGKSVLFIGYSFSDFNIRYLWFKLRKMMQGIANEDLPKSYILLSENNAISETLFSKIGIDPIILNNYEGNNLTEKLTDFLENLVIYSRKSIVSPIAINSQIDKLILYINNHDDKNIIKYLSLLVDSEYGNLQIDYIQQKLFYSCEFIDHIFDTLKKESLGLFSKLLLKVFKQNSNQIIYDAVIINFLKYKEVRYAEEENNYSLLTQFYSGKTLSTYNGLILLWNAIHWIKNSKSLKYDTTLFYLIFISINFKNNLNDLLYIEKPDLVAPRLLPPQPPYHFLSPQLVIDLIYSKVDWLPPINIIIENLSEFNRICENCHCLLQTDNYKYWEEFSDKNINKVFNKGKVNLS